MSKEATGSKLRAVLAIAMAVIVAAAIGVFMQAPEPALAADNALSAGKTTMQAQKADNANLLASQAKKSIKIKWTKCKKYNGYYRDFFKVTNKMGKKITMNSSFANLYPTSSSSSYYTVELYKLLSSTQGGRLDYYPLSLNNGKSKTIYTKSSNKIPMKSSSRFVTSFKMKNRIYIAVWSPRSGKMLYCKAAS